MKTGVTVFPPVSPSHDPLSNGNERHQVTSSVPLEVFQNAKNETPYYSRTLSS
jgi:hypothetical protein